MDRGSLVVQWLRLHAYATGDTGSTPGQGTKILHVVGSKNVNKWKNENWPQISIYLFVAFKLKMQDKNWHGKVTITCYDKLK